PGAIAKSDNRLHTRISYSGVLFMSWCKDGMRNCAWGKCRDVSIHGLGVEVPKRIPAGTVVNVRAQELGLDGSGVVRYIDVETDKYLLGLELQQPLSQDILDKLKTKAEEVAIAATVCLGNPA